MLRRKEGGRQKSECVKLVLVVQCIVYTLWYGSKLRMSGGRVVAR